MPNYIKRKNPGGYYFFTVVTYDRRPIFSSNVARAYLRNSIESIRTKRHLDTIAMVLMPEHLHCIWQLPPGDKDFSTRWGAIKANFSRLWKTTEAYKPIKNLSRQKRKESTIWQRRFWEHRIRNYDDLIRHIDYIHYNPVKHGKVKHPADWVWSTYKNKLGKNTLKVYPEKTIEWINSNFKSME